MRTNKDNSIIEAQDGAVLIEFALTFPVFILIIFGIIEFSLIFFAKSVMEGSLDVTARLGKTGYIEEGKSREQMLVDLLVEKTGGLMDPEEIEIETLIYSGFDDINQPEPLSDGNGNGTWDTGETYDDINGNGQWDSDMGTAGLGGAGDIVVYTIHYPWAIKTPVLSQMLGDTYGIYTLSTSIVVRNEPYNVMAGGAL